MNEDLPDGWVTATGKDLFGFVTSGSRGWAKYYADRGPRFLRVGNLDRDTVALDLRDVQNVNPPSGTEGARTRVAQDDILISITADVGMIAVVSDDIGEAYVNQHIALARPVGGYLPAYVGWYLASRDGGQRQFHLLDRGVIKGGLSLDDIRGVEVPLPPLAEQRRIVAKVEELLAQVNAAKDRLAKVPAILKRFRQAVLAAACSGKLTEDFRTETTAIDVQAPTGWTLTRVEDLLLDAKYGTSAKCGYESKSGIPVLRIPNIAKGELDLGDLKFAPKESEDWAKLGVATGDILVCRTNGSLELIGKAAVVPNLDRPMSFASYLIRLRFDQRRLLPAYFHLFLTSPVGRNQIEKRARTSAGQFNINLQILRDLEIPLPPITEQAAIVERAQQLLAQAATNEASTAAATRCATKIPQAILAKAFRGELVPTEAELALSEGRDYETAQQLLARVRSAGNEDKPKAERPNKKPRSRSTESPRASRRA